MNDRLSAGGIVLAALLVLAGLMAGLALAQGGSMIPSSANADASSVVGSAVEEDAFSGSGAPADSSSSASGILPPVPDTIEEDEPLTEGVEAQAWDTSWRVIGSALKPRDSDVVFHTNASGGCVYVSSGNPFWVWNTPIWLPPGSEVEYMRMYYVDSSAAADTCGWFTKYDLYGDIVREWGGCSSTSAGRGYITVAVTPTEVIDYTDHSYVLNWRPNGTGDTIQLCGFRLYYKAPAYYAGFLPTVTKRAIGR